MLTAITREISPDMNHCELTHLERRVIDVDLARHQHEQYQAALSSLGCEVHSIPTEPGLADSVFIEDTALVLDELAVLCQPGAISRRPEIVAVKSALEPYRNLESILAPGTVDGGDLLLIGKTIYAGLTTRTNQGGIEQLGNIVGAYGYRVIPVENSKCLHLKSAASKIAANTLLVSPQWIDITAFKDHELVSVDEKEPGAANAVLAGTSLIYPSAFPQTAEKLARLGFNVNPVNISEAQKAEGAVTCCSLIFESSR